MVKEYRKKPIVVSAVEWSGDNIEEIAGFCGENNIKVEDIYGNVVGSFCRSHRPGDSWNLYIKTLEGDMFASVGDYIIEGINGEFYPCKPDIFKNTYEEFRVNDPFQNLNPAEIVTSRHGC